MIRKHVRTLTNVKLSLHARIFARILREGLFERKYNFLETSFYFLFHSFFCKCPEGFVLDNDERTCIDIDECSAGSHNCSDFCVNADGSYHCSCPSGLLLSADGKTCETSDPCSIDNGGCSQVCDFTQHQVVCSCRNGFEIDSNDRTQCKDVNECVGENK